MLSMLNIDIIDSISAEVISAAATPPTSVAG